MKKKSASGMTNAARAEAVFKPVAKPAAPLDEYALEKKAFDDNRERLRVERLAREAASQSSKTTATAQKLRRFYEALPFGRRSNRIAYAMRIAAMPDAADGAEWKEDNTFNAAEEVLRDPGLKEVYAAAIKQGCSIVDRKP